MYEGYLTLAGVELINNERAAAYARNLGITVIDCPPCTIATAVGDSPYTTPEADEAPWYDPAAPESAGFAGFFGLEVKGYSSSPITRSPLERLSDGAVMTRSRFAHREVVYTGVMMAADQCALSYGLAWLSTALRGSTCSPCGGVGACAYTCCPSPDTEEETVRTMTQVGVLEGPITNAVSRLRSGSSGGRCYSGDGTVTGGGQAVLAEVEFTLALGRPWLYRAPIQIVTGVGALNFTECGLRSWDESCEMFDSWNDLASRVDTWAEVAECVQWDDPRVCPGCFDADGCPCPVNCADDPVRPPGCPEPPRPPSVPLPYDPCGICYDGPNTSTTVINVPPHVTPMWLDQVPLLEITTGDTPLRALLIRFYANPTGDASHCDPRTLDPCTACGVMAIPYVPPGATLSVDGREFTASLDCDGGRGTAVIDDSAGIFGPHNRPFTWPVFDCNGFCVTITVPCDFPSDELRFNVSVVAREDAA